MAEITLITPTGGRQRALLQLGLWLNDQTHERFTWLIVDDCDPPSTIPDVRDGITVKRLRPSWRWVSGMNTQAQNIRYGLDHATGPVLIIEDDDVYLPDYVATMVKALQKADLVGESASRYYNVATKRHRVMPGRRHSSLASTGLKGPAIDMLRRVCTDGARTIDMRLWRQFRGRKLLIDSANVVGIKGMPGRPGIGVGHKPTFGAAGSGVLRSWIGDRAALYEAAA